jgi:hypothetical protein
MLNRIILLSLLLLLGSGCVSSQATGRAERHLVGKFWGQGFLDQTRDAGQWLPVGVLALALPVASRNDDEWLEKLVADPVFSGNTSAGDGVMLGLGGASVALAGIEWLGGDEGKSTEVLLESALLTGGVVSLLKKTIDRNRPGGSGSSSSFPSGHAATAFCTATFLARRIGDEVDGAAGYLGYLLYLPASLVAINRVENERHHPTDVMTGALLATVFTNVIYNAHYGNEESEGIFGNDSILFVPEVRENGVGVGMLIRF